MINNGFTAESGNEIIENGGADLVAYGVPFISNPDLVFRFKNNYNLNEADKYTYYVPGPKGYTDYPFWSNEDKWKELLDRDLK